MNEEEKILELLSKSSLTEEEKKVLGEAEKSGLAWLIETHNNISKAVSACHPDIELLSRYVAYLNDPEEETGLTRLLPKLESHISKCEQCSTDIKLLSEEFAETENFISEKISEYEVSTQQIKSGFIPLLQQGYKHSKYILASLMLILITYSGLFAIDEFSKSELEQLSSFPKLEKEIVTRGRTTRDFSMAISELNNENYPEAVKFFESDIQSSENDNSVFYTHFTLGKTYIFMAETSYLGFFKEYDETKLQKGLDHFVQVLEKNTSGKFENINQEARLYIAKTLIHLGRPNDSKKYLDQLIASKSRFSENAKELLNAVNKTGG